MVSSPSENSVVPVPPWSSDDDWKEVNTVLTHLVRRHREVLERPRRLAQRIAGRLAQLYPAMEALCRRTCVYCPEPCCLHAQVWLDFKDLVFLHLAGLPVPERQPTRHTNDVCWYWQPRGCRLPRISRPWICTRYLCPVQTGRLRRHLLTATCGLEELLRGIQANRRMLEESFLERIV